MIYGNNLPYGYSQTPSQQSYASQPQMQQMQPVQQGYSRAAQPMPQQYSYASQPPAQMNVDWIQGGYSSAMAYPKPAPGTGVILMDSDNDQFYIKRTDISGMPLPIRTFNYTEVMQQSQTAAPGRMEAPDMTQYVTKDDIKSMLEDYLGPLPKGEAK